MINVTLADAKTLILVTFCIAPIDLIGTNAGLVTPNPDDTFETANLIAMPITCDDKDSVESNTGSRSRRYILSGCRWDHKDLTYSVGCVPGKYNRTLVEKDIARAFATWSNYTDLTFTPKTGKVDIVLRFGNIDGIKNRMAYAFFPCNGRGGEIVFDHEEAWAMIGWGKNQFYRVAVHEIGHALGMDHSNVKPSIMNYGLDNWPESGLPLDDINAVQKMYGPKTGAELQ